jgi:hypothetical protein
MLADREGVPPSGRDPVPSRKQMIARANDAAHEGGIVRATATGSRDAIRANALQRRRRQIEINRLRRHLHDPVPYGTWVPCRAHGNSSNIVECECRHHRWQSA